MAAKSLSVLQLTDTHFLTKAHHEMLGVNTEHYFLKVLNQAFENNQHYDVIIVSGDLAQDPCTESYQRMRGYLEPFNIPVLFLPGNHDNFELMCTLLNDSHLSCAKQHIFEHWQIICLNSQILGDPSGTLEVNELNLLNERLASHPNHHALIAVHHHCVPAQSEWMDTMMIDNHEDLFNLLKNHPQVKAIIHGHIHQELAAEKNHIKIFGTPSTCFQFTPKSWNFSICRTAPGYRKLLLHADGSIETTVERLPDELQELRIDGGGYLNHDPADI